MPTYIYVQKPSGRRGFDVYVEVYRVIDNIPKSIGSGDYQTRGWAGALGEAMGIIQRKDGYKRAPRGYGFVRKDIKIYEV